MPEKELHFYESQYQMPQCEFTRGGWADTEYLIGLGVSPIHTTQMGLLSTDLIKKGYRLFVHPAGTRDEYEIRLGSNTCTDKEIRPAHNLFRMWQAGAFRLQGRKKRGARSAE